ncbi:hypothetical protein BUALT_Bualt10G0043500 [Buddleja alternifolia]|uniref:Uncharacterized protein n=1 Tax=Buddleja alternifolia TaxID=168488 RepID=A0AAV6WXG0_9LAMI|nr:hypothetical protein BUALT_Bualt10G0043500 [Buddleja alternifolia]
MVEKTRSNIELLKNQNHVGGGVGHFGEIGGDSYGTRGGNTWNSGYQIPTKGSRVEFPHFNGDDLRGWQYKCEQFFKVDETPPLAKNSPPLLPIPKSHTPPYVSKPTALPHTLNKPNTGKQRRLSLHEIDEKRSKGLCFWCDEKFTREHICKNRRQLYLLEVPPKEGVKESEGEEESEAEEEEVTMTESHISMHAITCIHDFKTMRVTGILKVKTIHILIDTGSTHNFTDIEAAKLLGCNLEPMIPFAVSVADGNKIHSSFICRYFSWKMQGVTFTTDLMTIPLGGCDMVLGVQWLATLGDFNWNLSQLKMEFNAGNKKTMLRGMQPSSIRLISRNKVNKLMRKPS